MVLQPQCFSSQSSTEGHFYLVFLSRKDVFAVGFSGFDDLYERRVIVTVRKIINLAAGLWSLVVNAVFLLSVWVPPHWNNFSCFILTSGGQTE